MPHRQIWRRVHLWLGLLCGVPLALVATSGLPIAYWTLTDSITAPDFYPTFARPGDASIDESIQNARLALPTSTPLSLYIIDSEMAVHVTLGRPDGTVREIAVSLSDGEVLGVRDPQSAPVIRLYNFHTRFGLGKPGEMIVLAIATLSCASIITGLVVWWPPSKSVVHSLMPRLRRGRRLRDLHSLIGVYTLFPLLVAAVTTILLLWPIEHKTAVPIVPEERVGRITIASIDLLREKLMNTPPYLRLRSVRGLDRAGQALRGVAERGDQFWEFEAERDTGELLLLEPMMSSSLRATLRQMHVSLLVGDFGRAVMAIATLAPSVLLFSGIVWWMRRRGSLKRK